VIPDFSEHSLIDLLSLRGRVAVVTGGASGIGAATSRRLAEAGADVIIADLDFGAANSMAEHLSAQTSVRVVGELLDVRDSAMLANVSERALSEFGGLHIWVNNAGIYPVTGPAIDASDDFIDRMMEVNVRSTFAGAREAAKRMGEGGVIVNLASTAGFRPAVGIGAYVASKHAVVGLTKQLALEFAPLGIRVVGVAPGVIDTPGVREQLEPLKRAGLDVEKRMANTLLGRAGQPDDVARVIAMLVSDLSAWVTGVVVPVDAGSLVS
jgi:NAD(P)-dependent dehydrogenase (short-subunit alcohol dehydrogenase family)